MLKKVIGIILVIIVLSASSLTVFADPIDGNTSAAAATTASSTDGKNSDDDKDNKEEDKIPQIVKDLITGSSVENTTKAYVKITKPESDKYSTYSKSLLIAGKTEYDDVRICLSIQDSAAKNYKPLMNTDKETWWDIGSFGPFSKEITLAKGVNHIRIVAYRTSQTEELKEEDIQVGNYTITLLDETIVDKIVNGVKDLAKDLLSPFKK